jgi:hypothetical protein
LGLTLERKGCTCLTIVSCEMKDAIFEQRLWLRRKGESTNLCRHSLARNRSSIGNDNQLLRRRFIGQLVQMPNVALENSIGTYKYSIDMIVLYVSMLVICEGLFAGDQ